MTPACPDNGRKTPSERSEPPTGAEGRPVEKGRLVRRVLRILRHLPPQQQDRLCQILYDFRPRLTGHRWDLMNDRACIRRERRGDGSRYWRLYLERGTRYAGNLRRKRVYIGRRGGPALSRAILYLREVYFTTLADACGLTPCRSKRELLRKIRQAIEWDVRHL